MKKLMILLCALAITQSVRVSAQISCGTDSLRHDVYQTATLTSAESAEVTLTQADSAEAKKSLLDRVEQWYADNMNYGAVAALMAVESSFIPFPSEVVIPPAAFVVHNEDCALNVTPYYWLNVLLIILAGTLGALLGALINYFLSVWLGRPIVYAFADSKLGHLFLLSSEKIQKAEEYFNEHGKVSTFVGRFIPAIRQLISIPAGLARMPLLPFMGYTFLGAFLWNTVLALLGVLAHGQADLIHRYSHLLSIALLALLGAVVLYYLIRFLIKRYKR